MIALGAGHSARSRGEAGCLAHNCHIDVENPDRLMFVEEWESVDAVRLHFAVPASGAFVAEMRALSPQSPVIRIYAAEDVTAKLMGWPGSPPFREGLGEGVFRQDERGLQQTLPKPLPQAGGAEKTAVLHYPAVPAFIPALSICGHKRLLPGVRARPWRRARYRVCRARGLTRRVRSVTFVTFGILLRQNAAAPGARSGPGLRPIAPHPLSAGWSDGEMRSNRLAPGEGGRPVGSGLCGGVSRLRSTPAGQNSCHPGLDPGP
jgi:quinol monooxygenase YgiN